jgi:hypothetical protein
LSYTSRKPENSIHEKKLYSSAASVASSVPSYIPPPVQKRKQKATKIDQKIKAIDEAIASEYKKNDDFEKLSMRTNEGEYDQESI